MNTTMPEMTTTTAQHLSTSQADLSRAADLLRSGKLVAFPTETVYGLGADASNGEAVAAIFEAKGRPQFNPLIVHVASLEAAEAFGRFDDLSRQLAAAFWPGPFTLVLPRTDTCPASPLVSAGLPTIALRVPASKVAQTLLERSGLAIAAPSANLSGCVSPTTAAHVLDGLGTRIDAVIDGGPCSVGVESTVVGFQDGAPVLLRHGGVSREDIEELTGPIALFSDPDRPHSPGQLLTHYAPRTPVRLDAAAPGDNEAFLAFGPDAPQSSASLNLSPSANLREAAANLFACLRQLDAMDRRGIAVMPIPETGLGAAINDRLRRAAETNMKHSGSNHDT